MSQQAVIKERRRFVPEAAKISPTAALASMVVAVFVTLCSWLAFKSLNPVLALAFGASTGGVLLVIVNWRRRKTCPPTLILGPAGIVIEDRQERIIIPWNELAGVRHVTDDEETLEFSSRFGGEPFVLSVSAFSADQAAEIKRTLLVEAA